MNNPKKYALATILLALALFTSQAKSMQRRIVIATNLTIETWSWNEKTEPQKISETLIDLSVIAPDEKYIESAAFNTNKPNLFAFITMTGVIRILKTIDETWKDLKLVKTLKPDDKDKLDFNSRPYELVFSPDGNLIASASYDSKVRIWDVDKGQVIKRLNATRMEGTLAFTPDGNQMLYSHGWGACTIMDVKTWKPLRIFKNTTRVRRHFGYSYRKHITRAAAFHPSKQNVLASSTGTEYIAMQLWDISKEKAKAISSFGPDNYFGAYIAFNFSPDGKYLIPGHDPYQTFTHNAYFAIWDAVTAETKAYGIAGGSDVHAIKFQSNVQENMAKKDLLERAKFVEEEDIAKDKIFTIKTEDKEIKVPKISIIGK